MAKSKAGRTRWKRFGVALVPGVVIISGLTTAAANGAVPMSFAISGTAFKVSADKMVATDVVQYGGLTQKVGPNSKPVILSGFKNATFDNLCQSVRIPLPFSIGGKDAVVMVIKSGSAEAEDMIADLAQMTGNATFEGVDIGVDAAETKNDDGSLRGPDMGKRPPGGFAQQVDKVTVVNTRQTVYAVSAGTFRMPDLDIGVNFDNKECF
ncbi:DUF6230 family protein [Yinghuangia sp. YIM S09857]|uniref:DUF6230 family protein n=1 Tax=Yinghuangia sp. YIM S09857 TaxID=3436929 RepID=UPI003F52FD9B